MKGIKPPFDLMSGSYDARAHKRAIGQISSLGDFVFALCRTLRLRQVVSAPLGLEHIVNARARAAADARHAHGSFSWKTPFAAVLVQSPAVFGSYIV